MIDISTVTVALQKQLEKWPALVSKQVRIERSEYANADPALTPYIGIYRTRINYDPRCLGKHSNSWTGVVDIKLVAQEANDYSGADCEIKLEALVRDILEAVWDDPTLDGTVQMVNSMSIDYTYKETESETLNFQWAIINLQLQVQTG